MNRTNLFNSSHAEDASSDVHRLRVTAPFLQNDQVTSVGPKINTPETCSHFLREYPKFLPSLWVGTLTPVGNLTQDLDFSTEACCTRALSPYTPKWLV